MTEVQKEIEKKGNELLREQGITTEEAGLKANELGEVINQYYKDHPEEYQLLLRKIPSLENSIKDIIDLTLKIVNPIVMQLMWFTEDIIKMFKQLFKH